MRKVVVDCRTGTAAWVELTPAEEADRQERERAGVAEAAARETAEAQRQADLAVVRARASADPAFAALVRLVGLS